MINAEENCFFTFVVSEPESVTTNEEKRKEKKKKRDRSSEKNGTLLVNEDNCL